MGESEVVQGATVYDHGNVGTDQNWTKGEKQPTRCNDVPFALLFYAQLIAMVAVAGIYGYDAFSKAAQDAVSGTTTTYEGYLVTSGILGAFAVVVSAGMFFLMFLCAQFLIKLALLFSVFLTLALAVISFMQGSIGVGILGIIFFLCSVCYARAVWSRIPFATVNLITGMTAVKANCGVTIVAYIMVGLGFLWSIVWAVAFIGVFDKNKVCDENNNCTIASNVFYGYLFLLLVSFFFTHQVIQNTVHVSVAGVVGTWWFSPEESCCCGGAVLGSFFRSMTSSFGSICFGSLLVALIQATRQLANTARQEGADCQVLICIAECILACLESIVEYFNKWAYIYVGVYGYSYLQAGKNVMKLFQDRGFEAVIADDLVSNTLFLVSLIVGLLTGAVGPLIVTQSDLFPSTGSQTADISTAFGLGFLIGLVLTSITMSVVGSSVNTVIVCFADAPAEFQQNHPELSNKMRETWRGAFPECLN